MNAARRKAIDKIIAKIENVKEALEDSRNSIDTARGTFTDLKSELESARDEEQEYHDNMPESLQQGEKGEKAQEAINELETAISTCDDVDLDAMISSLDDIIASCENAKGV